MTNLITGWKQAANLAKRREGTARVLRRPRKNVGLAGPLHAVHEVRRFFPIRLVPTAVVLSQFVLVCPA